MKHSIYNALIVAGLGLFALPAHAETYVTHSVVTTPDGATTYEKTVSTDHYPVVIVPSQSQTVTTTTTSWSSVDSDEEDFDPNSRRVGSTYALGEDEHGNNVLRYENKTFDGFNN